MRTGAWDGFGRPVSGVLCLCDCVTTRGAPLRCWSGQACQSGMLWLALLSDTQPSDLVMVVTTVFR